MTGLCVLRSRLTGTLRLPNRSRSQPCKENPDDHRFVDHAGLLAVAVLASGAMKLTWPKEKLAALGMGWVEDFSAGAVKAIGTLEVLAAVAPGRPQLHRR